MQNNTARGTFNRNQGGQSQTRPQPVSSVQGLGNIRSHASTIRAESTHTARLSDDYAAANSERRAVGGQASLGLFGIPGTSGFRQRPAVAQSRPGHQAAGEVASGTVRSEVTAPAQAKAESFVEYDQRQPASNDLPLLLIVRQDRFLAMVRLDAYDQRPVQEVAAEWMAECQSLIGNDEADPHGDCPPARLSTAMRLAQIQADERETYGLTCEEAYEAHCAYGAGYTELQLAIEG